MRHFSKDAAAATTNLGKSLMRQASISLKDPEAHGADVEPELRQWNVNMPEVAAEEAEDEVGRCSLTTG